MIIVYLSIRFAGKENPYFCSITCVVSCFRNYSVAFQGHELIVARFELNPVTCSWDQVVVAILIIVCPWEHAVIRRIGGDIYNRELITTEDGGTLGLDWFKEGNLHEGWKPDTPIVLVMHGITGGYRESDHAIVDVVRKLNALFPNRRQDSSSQRHF